MPLSFGSLCSSLQALISALLSVEFGSLPCLKIGSGSSPPYIDEISGPSSQRQTCSLSWMSSKCFSSSFHFCRSSSASRTAPCCRSMFVDVGKRTTMPAIKKLK